MMGGMNPMMGGMNPMMGGMNPMMGGMNPMMSGMNPMMQFGGMNPGMVSPQPQTQADSNVSIDDQSGWNLIFENQNDKKSLTIRISEQKLVKEAISMYMLKSGRTDKCKFIFNNKELFQEMKICHSLFNLSRILVVSCSDDANAWNLIFENLEDKKSVTIRISEQKLVKEAINMYFLKTGITDQCKFIFNTKPLNPEIKISHSGLINFARIYVIKIFNISNSVKKNNSSNQSLILHMKDFNPAYYELQINELKEQLTIEKNKNSILMNENKKLNEMINNMNSNQLFLNNKISFLENELNKKNMEIQNYLNNMNNINNYNINDLVTSINPGEKIITVNFVSCSLSSLI